MREEEFDGYRIRPPTPYRPTGQLQVPRRAIQWIMEVCQRSGRLETCCFWYGQVLPTHGLVQAVVVPQQRQSWGNYSVSPIAMRAVHALMSPMGLRNLAQVHSHPGRLVEHSLYDDEMANSRKALSIVFPNYGRYTQVWPTGVGVHEFQEGYWHLLSDADAARRVVLVDSHEVKLIDCRGR